MEILNGQNQGFVGRSEKQAVDMGSNSSHHHNRRILWGLILICSMSLSGCGTLKSSLITGAVTSAAVGVTSVVAPGVLVPAAIGGTTAAVASALTAGGQTKGEPISVTADTVVNKAPDNFFTLLGELVGMGGWLLGLVLLLPMVLGWIIPGPLKMHKRKKKR